MSEQVISKFGRPKHFGIMRKGGHHQIEDGGKDNVQTVGENYRFNVTPFDMEGNEYEGNDPRVWDGQNPGGTAFYKADEDNGEAPIVEYEVGYYKADGSRVITSNSGNDPWHLNSYKDNGGCTPNLLLERPIGPGQFKAFILPYVRAKYNGGVDVRGPELNWMVD